MRTGLAGYDCAAPCEGGCAPSAMVAVKHHASPQPRTARDVCRNIALLLRKNINPEIAATIRAILNSLFVFIQEFL
jgi:hypothetical protein